MAVLPILMVWIYLSWMIVLLGLEMTYATQNLRTLRQDIRGARVNFASYEFITLAALLHIGRRFYRGQSALGHEELASQLDAPSRLLRAILEELTRLGFIVGTAQDSENIGYQPAQALEAIKLHDVIHGLAVDGEDYSSLRKTHEHGAIAELADALRQAEVQALDGMTLRDLVLQIENSENQETASVADGAAG
jgi:membrane protein